MNKKILSTTYDALSLMSRYTKIYPVFLECKLKNNPGPSSNSATQHGGLPGQGEQTTRRNVERTTFKIYQIFEQTFTLYLKECEW